MNRRHLPSDAVSAAGWTADRLAADIVHGNLPTLDELHALPEAPLVAVLTAHRLMADHGRSPVSALSTVARLLGGAL